MKLTEKDKTFLENLKRLMESKDLWVEFRPDKPSYMVLTWPLWRQRLSGLSLTRQGVRWRFWRIYNDIYVSAFEAILFVETTFGTQLRDYAIRISKERYALRQEIGTAGLQAADALQRQAAKTGNSQVSGDWEKHPPGA